MSNKKTYRKYAATTMAAAAAVASVAPVATAADTSQEFSDVNENHDFYEAITALAASGFITGFEDGTFRPSNDIKRVQVARIITNALGLEVPEDIEAALEVYNDVDAESEGADVIAAVTEAGIFGQFASGKGNFNSWKPITREQMASALVRALDLGQYDTGDKVDINLKGVDPSHAPNVQILANLGITTGTALDDFKPLNPIKRGQFAAQVYRALQVIDAPIEKEIAIKSVNAVNSKTLEVIFNQGVNADEATLEVLKSTIKQNVSKTTWSSDGKSVRLELSAKLTEGEYTVNVTGLTEGVLTESVKVENEKVDSIEILSDIAVVDNTAAPTSATVAYQVQNQYGEDITKTTSLTTNSNDITVNPANGVVTISGPTVTNSKVGDKVAIALVHAETATSATKVVTLSAEAAASEVEITGIYNKDEKELNEDTNLVNDKFYLLVDVKDQYGNAITKAADAAAGLIKSETNPTVIETAGAGNNVAFTELTIDGKKQLGIELVNLQKAGITNVILISTTTGKNATFAVEVAETTRTDVVNLSAPALAVAGEDILVPVSVLDKDGKAVTDLKVLNHAPLTGDYKGVKVTFNGTNVPGAFVKGDGDDNNIYIKVSAPTDGTFPLVAQSSTFKVATQTIKVEKKAVPTTVRGLKNPLAIAANKTKTIEVKDLVVEDQYGREMKADAVSTYLTAEGKGILVKKADDGANVVTLPSTTVPADNTITSTAGVIVTAGSANGTETLQFVLADNDGTNEVAASLAEETVRVTDGTEYDGYEIAEIGKVQASDAQGAGAKEFTVNGLLNGGKVALDQGTDYTATISGGRGTLNAVTNGEIDVETANLNLKDANNPASDPIDTEFTLKVTINATGEVLEQKFIVSAEDQVVEDFFFTTTAAGGNYDDAKSITEATLKSGSTVASTDLKAGATPTEVTFATTDQYGNKTVVANTAASTVTIVPEKASEVTITDNGTATAKPTLKGVNEAKLTVKVKVGNATKELKVTLIPSMPVVTGITATQGAITQGAPDIHLSSATALNQGITYTAKDAGVDGNNISVFLIDPQGINGTLSVEPAGLPQINVRVRLATDNGGNITSTVEDVVNAINAFTADPSITVTASADPANYGELVAGGVNPNSTIEIPLAGGVTTAGNDESSTLTVTGPVTATGMLNIVLTNPAKTVNVAVTNGETAAQVAANIVTALGTVTGYTVTDNLDGTITFTSTALKTNVPDLTVSVTNQ